MSRPSRFAAPAFTDILQDCLRALFWFVLFFGAGAGALAGALQLLDLDQLPIFR